jgi:hypothetical protein
VPRKIFLRRPRQARLRAPRLLRDLWGASKIVIQFERRTSLRPKWPHSESGSITLERFADLKRFRQPTPVVNGLHNEMIPVSNSY